MLLSLKQQFVLVEHRNSIKSFSFTDKAVSTLTLYDKYVSFFLLHKQKQTPAGPVTAACSRQEPDWV